MAQGEHLEWGLVGAGNIGGELADQVAKAEVAERLGLAQFPEFVLRSSGLYIPSDRLDDISRYEQFTDYESADEQLLDDEAPDILFITLPSNQADVALSLTKWAAGQGKLVVTAEKAMLAEHWAETQDATSDFELLGYNASVGGGNRLIDQFRTFTYDPGNVRELHAALNGTLTYMQSQMSDGVSAGIAAHEAIKLGYADPLPQGAGPLEVFRSEAQGDIPKKTSILFNALGLSEEVLHWRELQFELNEDELAKLEREIRSRRFIVSIYDGNGQPEPQEEIIGGFRVEHDGWLLVGGFRRVGENPIFDDIAHYSGTANGGVIELGPDGKDGKYPVGGGPGAGPAPTVNTMLDDAVRLRQNISR